MLHELGEAIGSAIAWLTDAFFSFWDVVLGVFDDFFDGLARGLGMQGAGPLAWLLLAVGLLLIVSAIQGFLRRSIVGPIILLALGFGLIAWAMA